MAEDVVVDFSRVEASLDLVGRARGLAVEKERARINSVRAATAAKIIAYCAGACALVIVSIGIAIWLARKERIVGVRQPDSVPREFVDRVIAGNSSQPAVTGVQPKPMIKVVQFNSLSALDVSVSNRFFFDLTAGHEYSTSNADRWARAWCYAMFRRDGVSIRVALENREGSSVERTAPSDAERHQLELNDIDIARLRNRCPWQER
jgi:hypothetical protein